MFEPLLELGDFYLVTASRPAYGRSSRDEGHSVASAVDDAKAALARVRSQALRGARVVGRRPTVPRERRARQRLRRRSRASRASHRRTPTSTGPTAWVLRTWRSSRSRRKAAHRTRSTWRRRATRSRRSTPTISTTCSADSFPRSTARRSPMTPSAQTFVESMTYGFANGWRGYFDDNVAMISPVGL